jgi:hypothetical protein
VTLSADTTVTAWFPLKPPVSIFGAVVSYFDSLSAAYQTAQDGGSIEVRARQGSLAENLNLNRNVQVALKGGFDSAFTSRTGWTILQGVLTVGRGKIVVEGFAIR